MLLIMNKYTLMLDALQNLQWRLLSIFVLGGMVGLLGFTRLLDWLLDKYYDHTVALLVGFMFGAMHKIWLWEQAVEPYNAQAIGGQRC